MRIKEFEGKAIFAEAGIRVPRGRLVRTPDEAWNALQELGDDEVVLKAQVLTGGRGRAGGVQFATEDTIRTVAAEIRSKKINGFTVHELLIEEKLLIEEELYVAITVDRHNKCMSLIYSPVGGMDIEEVLHDSPEKIFTQPMSDQSLSLDEAVHCASKLSDVPLVRKSIADVMIALYRIAQEKDLLLIEINPLVVTVQRDVVAADSKIVIDENALFRQEQFRFDIDREEDRTELEKEAFTCGFSYVEMDGTIGVIGNGAGLTMATLDLIHHFGSKPANFLDIGGSTDSRQMEQALEIVLRKHGVSGVCISVFGGITRCDEVAEGIVGYVTKHKITQPIVVRLAGTNSDEATKSLAAAGVEVQPSLEGAVKRVIELTS